MSENRHQMPGQWTKDARPRAHTHKLYYIPPLKSQRKVPHIVEGQCKQPKTNQQHILPQRMHIRNAMGKPETKCPRVCLRHTYEKAAPRMRCGWKG